MRELRQQIDQFSAYLEKKGYQAGDSAVIQSAEHHRVFYCLFASIGIGMRPVMSLPAHRHAEVSHFIAQTEAKLYICAE